MRPEKILVVDDHWEILELLAISLQLFGWEPIPVGSASEVLKKAKEIKPSLILLDIRMPGMDGLEVARSLKTDPDYREIPILALTGLGMPSDLQRCLEAGCDDCISKPFRLQELQERMIRLVSRGRFR